MISTNDVNWFWNKAIKSSRKGKIHHRTWDQFNTILKRYNRSRNLRSLTIIIIPCVKLLFWVLFI
jgi:hypothetical protein